jgi:molecular chaperone HtpG
MTEIKDTTQPFDADVSRLLDIVANALYTNQDVFLRELISNAADACDRLRYDALQNPDLVKGDPAFAVRITRNTEDRTLSVADNGIGMNDEDLKNNLGTIARSGTAAIMEQLKETKAEGTPNLIGRFGVGFYASFMVADTVDVVSCKAGDDIAWHWSSDGRTGYTLRKASDDEAKRLSAGRGTHITLHLKKSASDFLIEDKIRQVVMTWSDHIAIPVYLGDKAEGEEPINAASALWMRPKSEITKEQYTEFYHHVGQVFDEPALTAHWKAEGVIEYTALLFVPTLRPWDLYDPTRKHAVRLYVKRVYITDNLENLMYPWLRFVRGIIDSEDLPLNISREMLQRSPVVDKIRTGVTKKILNELDALSRSDAPAFEAAWQQFGAVIKEGLYDAAAHREDIFKICRFFSSSSGDKAISLDDYIGRMKDGQEEIYYITGEKRETIAHSPQLEGFKARGIEVLFFTDTVDSFWLQMADSYKDKKFVSITKGSVDLDKFESADKKGDEAKEKDKPANDPDMVAALLGAISTQLAGKVSNVRVSKRLTDSPVCLVAADQGVDMHMERVLKIQQKYEPTSKRVMEINDKHPLIRKLSAMAKNNPSDVALQDAAGLLYDQALIIQGEPVDDPAAFARRMALFMEKGLAA